MKIARVLFLTTLCLTLALPAIADSTLYENGSFGPDADAWPVSNGFAVGNTFTLTSDAALTGFQFWAWLFPGDSLVSAELSITSDAFGGTTYFDATLSFVQSDCHVNAYGYDVCKEGAIFHGPQLGAGTYWVNLQNAVTQEGNPVLWDENSGIGCHSPGCPSLAESDETHMYGTIPSESFTLLGTKGTGTTPEPGTMLLLATGLCGFAGALRGTLTGHDTR